MNRILPVCAAGALSITTLVPAQATVPAVGDPAPELGLTAILGADTTDLPTWEDMRGKVVVLEFWATWCGGVRRAHAGGQCSGRQVRQRRCALPRRHCGRGGARHPLPRAQAAVGMGRHRRRGHRVHRLRSGVGAARGDRRRRGQGRGEHLGRQGDRGGDREGAGGRATRPAGEADRANRRLRRTRRDGTAGRARDPRRAPRGRAGALDDPARLAGADWRHAARSLCCG